MFTSSSRVALLVVFATLLVACVQASVSTDGQNTSGTTSETSSTTASTSNTSTSNTTGGATTPQECPDNTCTLGEIVCNGPSTILLCEPDTQGCGTLVLLETCTDGSTCVQGECVAGCVDNDEDGRGEGCAAGPDCDDSNPDRYNDAIEICDGIDNDCNGQTDEGDTCAPDCSNQLCEPGTRLCLDASTLRSCEVNPEDGCGFWGETVQCPAGCENGGCIEDCIDNDNDGRGVNCALGPDCNDSNPNVYPGNTDVCDGLDNNCVDGADETFPEVGQSCNAGIGACRSVGVFECAPGGNGVTCSATAGQPISELCGDGTDNDCDGRVDEGFGSVGQSCADGLGECRRTGEFVCDGDQVRCTASAGAPSVEVCDGLDNNCNGDSDEGGVCNTCTEDSNEPNDSTLTGTSLPPGASSSGTVCGANDDGNLNRDWFSLGFYNAGQTITVDVEFNNPNALVHLELYTANGYKTATPNSTTGHRLTFTADESANYHIWVFAKQNPIPGTAYTVFHR